MPDRDRTEIVHVQSAVIPQRRVDGAIQVLLITSRSGRRWVIPKGLVEPGMSAADSAAKEALEEAGVQGRVQPGSVGSYRYRKWGGICDVEVFLMEVSGELDDWPEAGERQREWVAVDEALNRVEEEELRRILRQVCS